VSRNVPPGHVIGECCTNSDSLVVSTNFSENVNSRKNGAKVSLRANIPALPILGKGRSDSCTSARPVVPVIGERSLKFELIPFPARPVVGEGGTQCLSIAEQPAGGQKHG